MYQYHVEWWYDSHTVTNSGLVAADCYQEAVARISKQYGEDNIVELQLEFIGDTSYLIQYKDEATDLKKYFED